MLSKKQAQAKTNTTVSIVALPLELQLSLGCDRQTPRRLVHPRYIIPFCRLPGDNKAREDHSPQVRFTLPGHLCLLKRGDLRTYAYYSTWCPFRKTPPTSINQHQHPLLNMLRLTSKVKGDLPQKIAKDALQSCESSTSPLLETSREEHNMPFRKSTPPSPTFSSIRISTCQTAKHRVSFRTSPPARPFVAASGGRAARAARASRPWNCSANPRRASSPRKPARSRSGKRQPAKQKGVGRVEWGRKVWSKLEMDKRRRHVGSLDIMTARCAASFQSQAP